MIGIIVARSTNNVIGKDGKIPWSIKGEQKQFKELTTGQTVIMGRRSYEEIGHPLPNRETIVVSTTKTYVGQNVITARNLEEALSLVTTKNAYIAGGSRLFEEGLKFADKLFITEVDMVIPFGDTFFPSFDESKYDVEIVEEGGDVVKFTRTIYTKLKTLDKENNVPLEQSDKVNDNNEIDY